MITSAYCLSCIESDPNKKSTHLESKEFRETCIIKRPNTGISHFEDQTHGAHLDIDVIMYCI